MESLPQNPEFRIKAQKPPLTLVMLSIFTMPPPHFFIN